VPNPRLGYALVAASAACSALNGSLARYLLDDGMSAVRLSQLRSAVAFALLALGLALFSPARLRVARADVPKLAWLGIAGIALVHASYFAAIARIDIGVALVIQYLAPALLLIWLWLVHKRRIAPSLWAAVALSLAGSALVVDALSGASDLDALGVLAALAGAVTLVIYLVSSERAGQRYDAFTTLLWGFGFATLFWLVVAPAWTFPFELLGSSRNLLLALGVSVIGTLIPFLLMVSALRHLPAPRVAVVAMLEPVLGAVIAWGLHDQALAATQIVGGVIVLAAITWVQTHRPGREEATTSLEEWTSSSPEGTDRSPVAS
jgi:drug/metabolite transporter (DMT)-like permease